jgi:hypothetical protein
VKTWISQRRDYLVTCSPSPPVRYHQQQRNDFNSNTNVITMTVRAVEVTTPVNGRVSCRLDQRDQLVLATVPGVMNTFHLEALDASGASSPRHGLHLGHLHGSDEQPQDHVGSTRCANFAVPMPCLRIVQYVVQHDVLIFPLAVGRRWFPCSGTLSPRRFAVV